MARKADVIDFRQHKRNLPNIQRLLPELDGTEMLYTNDASDQVFSLKVLCWAVWSDGHIDGMVPWLNRLVACRSLDDPLNGHWEGFKDPHTDHIFFEIPDYKSQYLTQSAQCHPVMPNGAVHIVQEIPDLIGSHAVFSHDQFNSFQIQEIHSWRLYNDGSILSMCVEQNDVHSTPVLTGDDCLFSVQHRKDFHYFFQHTIANKIKSKDPSALAAMAHLGKQPS